MPTAEYESRCLHDPKGASTSRWCCWVVLTGSLAVAACFSDTSSVAGGGTSGPGSTEGSAQTSSAQTTNPPSGSSADAEGGSGGSTTSDGPVCGDGDIDVEEECDDANEQDCDGCESCEIRNTLHLDGADGHYVEVEDVDGGPLRLLGTPFTVEAWVRFGPGDTFDFGRHGSGNKGWRIYIGPGGPIVNVRGQFDQAVSLQIEDGTWHHVAWTYDQVRSRVYVDGIMLGEQAESASVDSTDSPVRLGATSNADGTIATYRAGRVDEIRVSETIRYDGDFTPIRRHVSDALTLGLWHLDGDAHDDSDHEHQAVSFGAQWEPDDGYGALFCG